MKAAVIPVICFVLGVAGGVFFSRPTGSDSEANAGQIPRKKPVKLSAITTSAKEGKVEMDPRVATRRSLRNIAVDDVKLIDLASRASSTTSRMLDFERATAHLSSEELLALIAKAETLPVPFSTLNWARNNLLIRVALADPDAAIEHAKLIKDRSSRDATLTAVVAEIAQNDVVLAFEKIAELDPRKFVSYTNAILKTGAEGAAAEVLAQLDSRSDVDVSRFDLRALGSAVTSLNLDQAMRVFDRLTSDNRKTQFLGTALGNLVKTDPAVALQLLDSHGGEPGSRRTSILGSISGAWLASDRESGRAWIQSLDDPVDRTAALQAAVSSSGEDRRWLLGEIAALPPDDHITTNLIATLTDEWGKRDPDEVVQWIHQLSPGPARHRLGEVGLRNTYVRQWATNDLETALPWVESLAIDDPMRSRAIRGLGEGWSGLDFDSAQDWANQIADEVGRHHAIDSVLSNAWGENLASAREILIATTAELSSEESETFAGSIRKISREWGVEDPAASFAWAATLANEKQRDDATGFIVGKWAKSNPEEAREVISAAAIDEDARQKLLKRLQE